MFHLSLTGASGRPADARHLAATSSIDPAAQLTGPMGLSTSELRRLVAQMVD